MACSIPFKVWNETNVRVGVFWEKYSSMTRQTLSFSQESSSSPVASKVEDDQIGFMEMSELLFKKKKKLITTFLTLFFFAFTHPPSLLYLCTVCFFPKTVYIIILSLWVLRIALELS